MYKLVLMRHGQSEWNAEDLFTGWVDVKLSAHGHEEAVRCGELLKTQGILPDIVHTSLLRRAITTADLALDAADRCWIPVKRSWRLNERHYGALQGLNKKATRDKYGDEQFNAWRRSYDVPPPPIDSCSQYSQANDVRYKGVPVPSAECLKDVVQRLWPYFLHEVVPNLRAGKTVLLSAHGNSLRALIKQLNSISDADIANVNMPTAVPLLYELDENLKPITPGGKYLDPEAAAASAAAVANQGQ